jgi:hypothetical protein
LSREADREVILEKMKVMFNEGSKIMPPEVAFKDPYRFMVFGMPSFIYNQSLSIKFGVSFVLYFKSIDNLGTEIHEKYK